MTGTAPIIIKEVPNCNESYENGSKSAVWHGTGGCNMVVGYATRNCRFQNKKIDSRKTVYGTDDRA